MVRRMVIVVTLGLFVFALISSDFNQYAQAQSCFQPPPSLISWWPGEGDAKDKWGGNDGTPHNGAAFTSGKVGQAFRFDGLDDVVTAPGNSIGGLQQLTIEAWVWLDTLPAKIQRFVTLSGEKAVLRHDGENQPGQLHFYMRIDGILQHIRVNGVLQAGVFYHVAGTYDGSVMLLYLDGVQVGSLAVAGTVEPGNGIELSSAGEPLDGLLDEVAVFNSALSAAEIQAIYSAGNAGKCAPTIYEIGDGEAGLDCDLVGVWDPSSQTCTLDRDLPVGERVRVCNDGSVAEVTLDGNGYAITGAGTGVGVHIATCEGVTLTNLVVQDFETGMAIHGGSGFVTLSTNRIGGNEVGVSLSTASDTLVTRNILSGNTVGLLAISANNQIFHNIFIQNELQIQDVGGNTWIDPDHQLGNFWGNYWGADDGSNGRVAGDLVGDTRLPHEGVDDAPLLDPSIPERFGTLLCADWWFVWSGGWSPVDVWVIDPFGRVISQEVNEIGDNAFYMQDDQVEPGSTLIRILVHRPCPGSSGEGIYALQMTALADLDYAVTVRLSERGEVISQLSVIDEPMLAGEIQSIGSRLEELVDPVSGQIMATVYLIVPIDVMPGSIPNSINPKSDGVVSVAILTSATFDATTVDPLSVAFGLDGATESHGRGHIEDVDEDGDLDLVLHFHTRAASIQCGGTSVSLVGQTFNGQAIEGSDSIHTVGCQ